MTSAAACFSGRATVQTTCRLSSCKAGALRQHHQHSARQTTRSSLEEEFKKQCLGRTNGTSSSSNSERLKDLSATRFGGGSSDLAGQSGGLQPPASDASGTAAGSSNYEEAAPFARDLPLGGEPYHPLEFYPTNYVNLDWGLAPGDARGSLPDRARCFVLLFGVGRTDAEGIYSLRAVARDDGLPVDTIVAFETEDDAIRYSTLLEAAMDHVPTVCPIDWAELLDFCNTAGYRCRLEPAGSLLIPPDYNVCMTDWEKSLRLRNGEYSVLGAEPTHAAAAQQQPSGLFLDDPAWAPEEPPLDEEAVRSEQLNAVIDSHLSSPIALEAMKASLERLLPRD